MSPTVPGGRWRRQRVHLKYSIADSCRTTLIDTSRLDNHHGDCKARSDEFCGFWPELYNNLHVLCPLCGVRRARAAVRRSTNKSAPSAAEPSGWCRFSVPPTARGWRAPASIRRPSRCGASSATSASSPSATRDFNDRQSQIFVVIASFLLHYAPPDLHGVIDDDVAEATAALASTYETGVARA